MRTPRQSRSNANQKTSNLEVPEELRRGSSKDDADRYVKEGRELLGYMAGILGLESLGDSQVLDVGCGTKFTEAILRYDIPVGKYVGIDVYKPTIEHLRQSIDDPRFSFQHMDTHNEMYNPQGQPLRATARLPIEDQKFDVICLYSVFTHLEPHDYHNMLRVLRPYIRENGRLVFSLFVDELSGTGYGLIEQIVGDAAAGWKPSGVPFRDAKPGKPLYWALYSREYAFELIEDTGWKVEDLLMPTAEVQHHFICSPV